MYHDSYYSSFELKPNWPKGKKIPALPQRAKTLAFLVFPVGPVGASPRAALGQPAGARGCAPTSEGEGPPNRNRALRVYQRLRVSRETPGDGDAARLP